MTDADTGISHETEFYRRQYEGGIVSLELGPATKVAKFQESLSPGKRYGLVNEIFEGQVRPDDVIVELGSGQADCLVLMIDRYKLTNVTAVDVGFAEDMQNGPLRMINRNLNQKWDLDDGSIDYLIALMVFEHLFDPFHCFEEVKRVLKPRGVACVNLPIVSSLKNRIRLLFGQIPVTSSGVDVWFRDANWDGNHLHYFTVPLLKRLADRCGLAMCDYRGVGRFHQIKGRFPNLLAGELSFTLRHK